MAKKVSVFFIFLSFIMSLTCLFGFKQNSVLAEDVKQFDFKSKAVYVCDANTMTVITKKDEDKRLPIASMCKVMTLVICFDNIKNGQFTLDDTITVGENASSMGGSQVFLENGGEYKASELIKSIVVASANDSCVAMAEKIAGSEQLFVDMMNNKASELGMNNTHFVNCTGLPQSGQYSCAKDVAIMFSELIKNQEYFNFSRIWMDTINHPADRITQISNTNKLIRFYQGCDSGKTGYTSEAGHCLVASAKRGDMRLISVVIGAPDSKTRFFEVSSNFNYGFANYTNKLIIDCEKPLETTIKVEGGKQDEIIAKPSRSFSLFSPKNEKRAVEIQFKPFEKVNAPVQIGDVVGKIYIYENGKELDCIDAISTENVKQKNYFDIVNDIANNWAL